jgi:PadR family transcriptional regulator, regulatory protein AphA
MELTKTSYVVLGMLRMGKRTGYEIKQLVDVSTRFFWAASYGQIYPELKRLEESGLLTGEADPQGGRQRRAFELTPTGQDALNAWLTSEEPLHFELRHEGILKFFFAGELAPEQQVAQVAAMRREHEQLRAGLTAIGPDDADSVPGHPLMTLRFGIAYQDFIIGWCERTERELLAGAVAG